MGYVMSFLCVAAWSFAIIAPKVPGIGDELSEQEFVSPDSAGFSLMTDEEFLELNPLEVLNFYMVGFIFAVMGIACFFIARRKRKILFHETPPKER
jgi:hypothetical protein